MLKQIKIGFLTVLTMAFLASCQSDGARDQAVQAAAGSEGTAATDPSATPAAPGQVAPTPNAAEPAAPVGPTTSIQFPETEFNFGKVKAGEKVRHEYKFKNTGKEPLIISNAKGSCGCTVPEWPKEPIPVGGEGSIMVQFDSKGKSGNQTKQVTITANTDPPQSIIYIKGEVMPDPDAKPAEPNVQVNK
ncbi:MAG: DUF1573 domain-containing protein [Lewinellaceae bacterium]|nr:DUF1573 domain-containing protein [Saprospiraceae bacterium]MCB9341170.1 DUF1573 domain-containing protein [Lewinellaceae bacterium]